MHAGRILSISVPNGSSVPDAFFSSQRLRQQQQQQQQQQRQQQENQAEEQEEAARCRQSRNASLLAAGRALSPSSLVMEKRRGDKNEAEVCGAGTGRGGIPRLGQPPNAEDDAALVRLLAGLQREADNLTNRHSTSTSTSTSSSNPDAAPFTATINPHHFQGAHLEALEALLESNEGTDIELYPSSRPSSSSSSSSSSYPSSYPSSSTTIFPPPLTLHSSITRHGTRIFRPKTRVQVPWSSPVTHALATFLYTGRLVVSTAHLADTYRAAQEAGVRSLAYLLRTYPFYALRLTSAQKAR